MMGSQSGVASFIRKENQNIFILGCPCHLLHLFAEKGASVLPFSPVDLLTPVFYYLEKSSKRHKAFKAVQQMLGAENHAILKHVCTHWLSMERAVGRLIEQWEPLKEFFRLEAESDGASQPRKQKAKVTEESKSADREGQSSQAHAELVGGKRKKDNEERNPKKQKVSQEKAGEQSKSVASAGQSSIKKRPSSVLQSKCRVVPKQSQLLSGSKKSLEVAPGIQKVPSRGESAFSLKTQKFSDSQSKEFYESVRKYFIAVTDYVIAKFPLEDEVIRHAQVANPGKRLDVSFSSLSFFGHKFHMEDKLDIVEQEFLQYQVDPLLNISLDQRVDEVWTEIRSLKDHMTDKLKYDNLGKLMHAILALPHSNADDECLFSLVRKNSKEFRPSLKTTTLSNILTKKNQLRNQAMKVPCYNMKFPDKLLEKCKKAATSFVSGSSA